MSCDLLGLRLILRRSRRILDIHAAVEHLFIVHAAGGKQLFAAQHLLGRALERDQEVELACACLPST